MGKKIFIFDIGRLLEIVCIATPSCQVVFDIQKFGLLWRNRHILTIAFDDLTNGYSLILIFQKFFKNLIHKIFHEIYVVFACIRSPPNVRFSTLRKNRVSSSWKLVRNTVHYCIIANLRIHGRHLSWQPALSSFLSNANIFNSVCVRAIAHILRLDPPLNDRPT